MTENDPPKYTSINETANNLTKKIINLNSYANILKGNTNPTQKNEDNIYSESQNENLQKTITKFIENILHNIQFHLQLYFKQSIFIWSK